MSCNEIIAFSLEFVKNAFDQSHIFHVKIIVFS